MTESTTSLEGLLESADGSGAPNVHRLQQVLRSKAAAMTSHLKLKPRVFIEMLAEFIILSTRPIALRLKFVETVSSTLKCTCCVAIYN